MRSSPDIERAARVAGISVGSMARVCALHWCAFVAAEMKASGREFGRVRAMNGASDEEAGTVRVAASERRGARSDGPVEEMLPAEGARGSSSSAAAGLDRGQDSDAFGVVAS
jgi:hypothetical protein